MKKKEKEKKMRGGKSCKRKVEKNIEGQFERRRRNEEKEEKEEEKRKRKRKRKNLDFSFFNLLPNLIFHLHHHLIFFSILTFLFHRREQRYQRDNVIT